MAVLIENPDLRSSADLRDTMNAIQQVLWKRERANRNAPYSEPVYIDREGYMTYGGAA